MNKKLISNTFFWFKLTASMACGLLLHFTQIKADWVEDIQKQISKTVLPIEQKKAYEKGAQATSSNAELQKIVNNTNSFLQFQTNFMLGHPRLPVHPYIAGEQPTTCLGTETPFELLAATPYYIRPASKTSKCTTNCSVVFLQGCAIPSEEQGTMFLGQLPDIKRVNLYQENNKICFKSYSTKTTPDQTGCVDKKGKTLVTILLNADNTIKLEPTYQEKPAGSLNKFTVKNETNRIVNIIYNIQAPCGKKSTFGTPNQVQTAQPQEEKFWQAACPLLGIAIEVMRPNGMLIQQNLQWKGEPLNDDGSWKIIERPAGSDTFVLEKD